MGHNVSSVHGVKSSDFYAPGNAVNEIWIDKFELISRLPFGDSDLGQASWPPHDWPKIPWHQFIIPLKRDLTSLPNATIAPNAIMDCTKPLIFGADSAWAYSICFAGIAMAELGFFMCGFFIYTVPDAFRDIDSSKNLPLRFLALNLQPRRILKWTLRRILTPISGAYILIGAMLVGLGSSMALSGARCMPPVRSIQYFLGVQGFLLLELTICHAIWLGLSLRKAMDRRDGDNQDICAEALCKKRYPWLLEHIEAFFKSPRETSLEGPTTDDRNAHLIQIPVPQQVFSNTNLPPSDDPA